MFVNSGYLNNSHSAIKDFTRPLMVTSCGNYKIINKDVIPTFRPKGRIDYQIIYIVSGKAHFHFENAKNETIVTAGHMVVFRPKEFQKYEYFKEDNPEVFWIHFTGKNVKDLLRTHGIKDNERIINTGNTIEYEQIFRKIISELQQCNLEYEETISLLFKYLLILIRRQTSLSRVVKNEYLEKEMSLATQFFSNNYALDINIEEYATSRGMSISWFIRKFKVFTGVTPMQYVLSLRITNAQVLLETTTYSVNEISRIVGYDNPLYFSRLFHKERGLSPSEYRKRQVSPDVNN